LLKDLLTHLKDPADIHWGALVVKLRFPTILRQMGQDHILGPMDVFPLVGLKGDIDLAVFPDGLDVGCDFLPFVVFLVDLILIGEADVLILDGPP
jgi:hypothetical protein